MEWKNTLENLGITLIILLALIGLAWSIAGYLWSFDEPQPIETEPQQTFPEPTAHLELIPIENQVQEKISSLENKYNPDKSTPWRVEDNLVRVDLMNMTENSENRFDTFIQAILVRKDNQWIVENILRLEDNRGVQNE